MQHTYWHYDAAKTEKTGDHKFCPFCQAELGLKKIGNQQRPACPACGYVQFRNPAPTVSVLIIDGDRVLLGQRAGEPGKGTWSVPSGYVEWEDDFLSTAISEAREETGLEVEVQSILNVVSSFVSSWFHFLGIYVVARAVGGELAAGDDLSAVEWVPMTGPLPEMGFQEDVDAIRLCASQSPQGLPVGG